MVSPYRDIVKVFEVHLRDIDAVAECLEKKMEPLNIIKTVKRFLWWEKVDYVVLFGQPKCSPRDSRG